MNVLVDTSVWSLAFRRRTADLNPQEQGLVDALGDLIRDGRAQIVGPVRQEVLSGMREPDNYRKLRDRLRVFPDPHLEGGDYEEAAQMSNQCRSRGISGSPIDFLICSVARRNHWQIFTTDEDFENYREAIPVNRYLPR